MKTVVILANTPKFVRGDLATSYYTELVKLVEWLGCKAILHEPGEVIGEEFQVLVAHGKRCDTLPVDNHRISVKLGHPDGVIHPVDMDWQLNGSRGVPPVEHFILTSEQMNAVQEAVKSIPDERPAATPPRQSASRRPGVR